MAEMNCYYSSLHLDQQKEHRYERQGIFREALTCVNILSVPFHTLPVAEGVHRENTGVSRRISGITVIILERLKNTGAIFILCWNPSAA